MGNLSRLGLAEYPHRHSMSQQARDHLLSQACLLAQLCKGEVTSLRDKICDAVSRNSLEAN